MESDKISKNIYERNRITIQEFLDYKRQREMRERLKEVLQYYEDYYFEDGENDDNRSYRYR